MHPLKFKPILKTLVWGTESWELSGVTNDESVVAEGPLAGKTIAELTKEYKGQLVGKHVYENTGDEFPMLVKFIDAKQDLSIQVHPNDEVAAARHNGSKGKTEMWYVIALPLRHPARRRLLPARRPHPRHLRRQLHRRDPADLRPHLPHLRLQSARAGRQAPPAAHRMGQDGHRLHRLRQLPHGIPPRKRRGDAGGRLPLLHHQRL